MYFCFLNTNRPLQRQWNFPYVDKSNLFSNLFYSRDDFIGFYFTINFYSCVIEINIEEILIYKLKRNMKQIMNLLAFGNIVFI